MQLIVITSPHPQHQEVVTCSRLFEEELPILHLRKPEATIDSMRKWIQQLPYSFHPRVMLHSHHELAQEFQVKGLHFTEANKAQVTTTPKHNLCFSTSFHQLSDLEQPNEILDYAFLSPIFQSISKKNYPAAFTMEELKLAVPQAKVPLIALGGITAEQLPLVQQLGFAGAAVLGFIWESADPVKAFKELQQTVKG